jgi:hypothetical protein
MPDDYEVKIEGFDGLVGNFKRADADTQKTIKRNLRNVGFLVQREARRRAPYKEGSLERSISFEVGDGQVKIYVPINSAAGRYALEKHDGTYNRGAGTIAKGPQAGPKYISRAIKENEAKILSQLSANLGTI